MTYLDTLIVIFINLSLIIFFYIPFLIFKKNYKQYSNKYSNFAYFIFIFLFHYWPLSQIIKHNDQCVTVDIPNKFLDKNNSELILKKFYIKLIRNSDYKRQYYNAYKIYQSYFYALSTERITWNKIELLMHHSNINKNIEFDCVVAVFSGGGFIGKRLADIYGIKNIYYIKCKMWSQEEISEQLKKVSKIIKNKEIKCEIEIYTNKHNIRGKKVLLVDDTAASGTTIKNCKQYLEKKCEAKLVKSYVLFTPKKELVDYYSRISRVPLFWPWGYELN